MYSLIFFKMPEMYQTFVINKFKILKLEPEIFLRKWNLSTDTFSHFKYTVSPKGIKGPLCGERLYCRSVIVCITQISSSLRNIWFLCNIQYKQCDINIECFQCSRSPPLWIYWLVRRIPMINSQSAASLIISWRLRSLASYCFRVSIHLKIERITIPNSNDLHTMTVQYRNLCKYYGASLVFYKISSF